MTSLSLLADTTARECELILTHEAMYAQHVCHQGLTVKEIINCTCKKKVGLFFCIYSSFDPILGQF